MNDATKPDEQLTLAAKEWIKRHNYKSRPKGEAVWTIDRVKHVGKMKFVAAPEEIRDCCKGLDASKLFQHCRSARHIANLFGVTEKDLTKAVMRVRHGHN